MSDSTTQQSDQTESNIVCPLSLKIMIVSEGRCGSIQSYRCTKRANGWETRPQKTDKWRSDFEKVLTSEGEVTLSDNQTTMRGLGLADSKVFKFTQEDGEKAFKVAMKKVTDGHLRAPRNWDRTFADQADMTLDELKQTYPELYATTSRTNSGDREDEEIQPLDSSFFEDDDEEEGFTSHVKAESDDEEMEEESYEEEPAYSVVAELEEEETAARITEGHAEGKKRVFVINYPPSSSMVTVHAGVEMLKIDLGGKYVDFYRVHTDQGDIFLREGTSGHCGFCGSDRSPFTLKVNGKPE